MRSSFDNAVLNMMYKGTVSIQDFNWDRLYTVPILSLMTIDDINYLKSIVLSPRYSGNVKLKVEKIDEIMKFRGFTRFASGTNRIVYTHPTASNAVFKVALDSVGISDNPNEFRIQNKLKPYCCKVFECSPCGTIASFEKVDRITTFEEFYTIADDYFYLLSRIILGKYVMDDIGIDYFMNIGIRRGFGPVLLDFPYCYELDGAKLKCNMLLDDNSICGGEIDYDAGFNKLLCCKCGRQYRAKDLSDPQKAKSILVSKRRNNRMKIAIRSGDDVIKRIDTEDGVEYISKSAVQKKLNGYNAENNSHVAKSSGGPVSTFMEKYAGIKTGSVNGIVTESSNNLTDSNKSVRVDPPIITSRRDANFNVKPMHECNLSRKEIATTKRVAFCDFIEKVEKTPTPVEAITTIEESAKHASDKVVTAEPAIVETTVAENLDNSVKDIQKPIINVENNIDNIITIDTSDKYENIIIETKIDNKNIEKKPGIVFLDDPEDNISEEVKPSDVEIQTPPENEDDWKDEDTTPDHVLVIEESEAVSDIISNEEEETNNIIEIPDSDNTKFHIDDCIGSLIFTINSIPESKYLEEGFLKDMKLATKRSVDLLLKLITIVTKIDPDAFGKEDDEYDIVVVKELPKEVKVDATSRKESGDDIIYCIPKYAFINTEDWNNIICNRPKKVNRNLFDMYYRDSTGFVKVFYNDKTEEWQRIDEEESSNES